LRVDQKREYWADSRRVERRASFWMDSTRSDVCGVGTPVCGVEDVDEEGKGCVCGGRRARERENAGEGKTVRALARMLVVVSGWRR
jgi:hypothetical protein